MDRKKPTTDIWSEGAFDWLFVLCEVIMEIFLNFTL